MTDTGRLSSKNACSLFRFWIFFLGLLCENKVQNRHYRCAVFSWFYTGVKSVLSNKGRKWEKSKILMKMFEPKGEELIVGWRGLYNEDLHDLYSLACTARVIKEGKMGDWCGTHRIEEVCLWWLKVKERRRVNGRIIINGS